MADAPEVVANAATGNPMLLALSKLAPAKFQAPAAVAPIEAAPVVEQAAVEEPAAEVTEEPVLEVPAESEEGAEVAPVAEAALAVEAAAEDPRIAELTARVAEQAEQLKAHRTAEQKAADTAELSELKGLITGVKEAYGEDTPIAKVMDKFAAMLDKTSQKAEAAQEVTVARDADSAHKNSRTDAPVMSAIYAALDKTPNDAVANRHLNMANIISQEIMTEQGVESINWKDGKSLAAHYKEVEKRLVEDNPGLRTKYAMPAVTAKPAAAAPTIKPAAIKGPTTMSGIKGGQTLAPAKPLELGKLNMKELLTFASKASPKQIAATTRH